MKPQELRSYLLSSCRFLQTEAGVEPPDESALWVEWVVARSLCVFRSVDISAVSGQEVESLLRMQVQSWAPFDDPEFCHREYGNRALVWAWDGALRRERCKSMGVAPDIVLPESLVREASGESGDESLNLVSCLEGVEGQYMDGSRVSQSRWWPASPDIHAWNQFRMLFDLPPADEVPEPAPASMTPTDTVSTRDVLVPFFRAESTLFVVSFSVFIALAAFFAGKLAYTNVASVRAESRIEVLNEAITPILQARDQALDSMSTVEKFAALRSGPLQLQYLESVFNHLAESRAAGQEVEFLGWDFSQTGVSMSVASEELSADELLTVFEALPWLGEVRVSDDSVRGRMRISGQIIAGWRFPEVPEVDAEQPATGDNVAVAS